MKRGVLIISHGSRDTAWVTHVEHTIEAAKARYYEQLRTSSPMTKEQVELQFPIVSSYLELVEGRLIQDGINTLQNKGVTHIDVLPLFVSAGSTHLEEIKQAFGFKPSYEFIGDLEPLQCSCSVNFDLPLIDDEELVQILTRQLTSLQIEDKSHHAVLVLGHGSSDKTYYQLWEDGMKQLLNKLQHNFKAIHFSYAALLPDHSKAELKKLIEEGKQVTVLPLFLSPGYFTRKVIPERLSEFNFTYTGETLLPSDEMVQLLIRRYETLFK